MKKNAQKILLCLFSFSKSENIILNSRQLKVSVPDMTDGGYRSLLLFLQRKKYLTKENVGGAQYYGLTDLGREALRAKFPALNDKWQQWNGDWHAMTFIKAPKSDPQFRYLRQLLVAEHALPLARGVYLAAGGFSPLVLSTCQSLYQECVVIVSVGEWQFGLDRPIIVEYYDLASTASVYSSIGSSIDKLLEIFNNSKNRTDQQKMQVSTTIDRL
ncbi:MAG: hypothetical protein QG639_876, partial [Patescibacteria group bacterium]|nr:hypothetical protein [Patescibacteria group bacterium]